jgi:ABC-type branched-subunit amino acid transport system substrate-binding protein
VAAASGFDAGGFGDIETVCQEGDASGATDVGVTDDSIQIGTLTDKGFTGSPGLIAEMYDAAVAFADWCNEHGGINGRELVIADRDAAITEYNTRIIEACDEDFALVGGGAALDDSDNGQRVACGLANIAGYVVSQTARSAGVGELQVQPVPNPPTETNAGIYQSVAEQFPETTSGFGVLTAQFGSTTALRDETVAAAEASGFEVVYSEEYAATGESNWRPFVEQMQAAGVRAFEFIGDPTFLAQVLEAMQLVGYQPDVIVEQANLYDARFAELAGDIAEPLRARLSFTPMELAGENQATADYLDLMERYNPDGRTALLGMQSISSFLLFARAATACGSELTRQCLIDEAASVTEWTGGGLHAPTDPAANTPSQCFVLVSVSADGYAVDEELTAATDGIFNCEDDNLVDIG